MGTRKSTELGKPVAGDEAKYLCYREAWTRITLAREGGFPFEAITILESIMADRISTYLDALGCPPKKGHESLGSLIRRWQAKHPDPIEEREFADLQAAVDEWRSARNSAVHGIVKSPKDASPSRIDNFLEAAQQAVVKGEAVARALSNWSKRATPKGQST